LPPPTADAPVTCRLLLLGEFESFLDANDEFAYRPEASAALRRRTT
jgi:hypothetical protein